MTRRKNNGTWLANLVQNLRVNGRKVVWQPKEQSLWKDNLGAIAEHSWVIRIVKRHALIGVDSSPWLNELNYLKDDLLESLRGKGFEVDDLTLVLRERRTSDPRVTPRKLSAEQRVQIAEITDDVDDKDVQAALRALFSAAAGSD